FMMKYMLAGFLLTIFLFALMPGQMTPAFLVNHDKAAHAAAFFLLALMLHKSFVSVTVVQRLMILVGIGVSIEILQYLFADRGFSFEDIAYDLLGITLYTLVSMLTVLAVKIFNKQSKESNDRV
ncbi:MAG: VanZ family protein, partial [Sulfurimonadaceae bacterium]